MYSSFLLLLKGDILVALIRGIAKHPAVAPPPLLRLEIWYPEILRDKRGRCAMIGELYDLCGMLLTNFWVELCRYTFIAIKVAPEGGQDYRKYCVAAATRREQ